MSSFPFKKLVSRVHVSLEMLRLALADSVKVCHLTLADSSVLLKKWDTIVAWIQKQPLISVDASLLPRQAPDGVPSLGRKLPTYLRDAL